MNEKKKELAQQYLQREIIGAVYALCNTENGKRLVMTTVDHKSSQNRFQFAQSTNLCTDIKLRDDWAKYGAASFEYETLETLKKEESQSMQAFQEDLDALKEIWLEKLDPTALYE